MSNVQVLIVEDDMKISEINRRFTEKVEGFEVCGVASSIDEAKEVIDILEPDLLLLDVYFPDGDGIDFLWYIRQHYRDVDVILITAAKEVDRVEAAIRGGVFDFLIKPIIFKRLQQTLEKYREYRNNLQTMKEVNQHQVDRLLHRMKEEEVSESVVPKGIDPLTLKKVQQHLLRFSDGVTAEELGQYVGVSRTTARRYLEYLVSTGAVRADLTYGSVGRPERRYISLQFKGS
jgi:two-component system, CitB family, response regulator